MNFFFLTKRKSSSDNNKVNSIKNSTNIKLITRLYHTFSINFKASSNCKLLQSKLRTNLSKLKITNNVNEEKRKEKEGFSY